MTRVEYNTAKDIHSSYSCRMVAFQLNANTYVFIDSDARRVHKELKVSYMPSFWGQEFVRGSISKYPLMEVIGSTGCYVSVKPEDIETINESLKSQGEQRLLICQTLYRQMAFTLEDEEQAKQQEQEQKPKKQTIQQRNEQAKRELRQRLLFTGGDIRYLMTRIMLATKDYWDESDLDEDQAKWLLAEIRYLIDDNKTYDLLYDEAERKADATYERHLEDSKGLQQTHEDMQNYGRLC